jgi:hypothetical protein
VRLIRHTAIASVFALGGCASPYVLLEKPSEVDDARPKALADAIAGARGVQNKYREKVIELGDSERALSNSLLGLGTLIIGLGVAKVHSSAITGAVLGTGAVYTIGTANTDKHRAQTYIAGMKALDCAVDAVTPLILSEPQEKRLVEDRARIQPVILSVGNAMGDVERWSARARLTDAGKFSALLDAGSQALGTAQAAVGKANEAVDLASQRTDKPHQIANDLRGAVSAIDRAVLDEIRGTENAVQAVPGILASLQGNAALFSLAALAPATVAKAPATGASGVNSPMSGDIDTGRGTATAPDAVSRRDLATLEGLSSALGNLRAATVVLSSLADQLARSATASSAQTVSTTLKTCQVEGVVKPISASPTTVSIVAKTAATQSILVDGGNGNFTAAFLQTPTPGLTAVIRPRSKGVVDVVATDQTVAGSTYQLIIEDTTQQSRQTVSVTIAPAVGGADTPKDSNTKTGLQDSAIQKLVTAKTLKLASGATVTVVTVVKRGDSGIEVTYRADAGAKVSDGEVAAAAVVVVGNTLGSDPSAVVATLDANAPHARKVAKQGKAVDWGNAVDALTPAQVKTVQSHLCMTGASVTGVWGTGTQSALRADRDRRVKKDSPKSGSDEMLTVAEAKALLGLSDADAMRRCVR